MAIFKIHIEALKDDGTKDKLIATVKSRSNADLRTVGVKALSKVIPMYFSDSLDAMDSVKATKRNSFEWEDFAEEIESEFDIKMKKPFIEE